ncbi:hypothetical protein [Kribbella sp.]|uniref:hypothetical protein n=1 Tax=Kribbella sp. TaxID=1871183 RepID=UPI002D6CF913|nr:hypothetical protein [Kribbella sp.]HZX05642.1 hypothetical protein [Kribbella sp.]
MSLTLAGCWQTSTPAAPVLGAVLAELPGRRYVYSNGSAYHAEQVLTRLGPSSGKRLMTHARDAAE